MFKKIKDISGLAYSGGALLKSGGSKYVIDLSSIENIDKVKIFIKEEHQDIGSIGDANLRLVNSEGFLSLEFDGEIFDYDDDAKRVAHQLDRGLKWRASVGIMPEEEISDFSGEVNGQKFDGVTLLRGGSIEEVSLTIYPADKNTSISSFYFCNKNKIDNQNPNDKLKEKGVKQMEFMTKAQFMEFACACGGNSSSTPRDLEKRFQELEEDSKELESLKEVEVELKKTEEELKAEIEALQKQIVELNEQLKKYTDAEGIALDEEIEEFTKNSEIEFTAEDKKLWKENPMLFAQIKKVTGQKEFRPKFSGNVPTGQTTVPTDKNKVAVNDLIAKAKEALFNDKENKFNGNFSAALSFVSKEG